jgi:transketolase
MRTKLSQLICQSAINDPRFIVISGDHGYALFDAIREHRPKQFINAGVAEQAVVGLAAGLARTGFKLLVYGLAAFIPTRVLEQIKLDVCFSNLPVTFLGDGGGVVYSTLGASHHSAEDIACLRPFPGIRIYSPADITEVETCYNECMAFQGPTYLRIGKSDRPVVHGRALGGTDPVFTFRGSDKSVCLVATGSMASPAQKIAEKLGVHAMSIPRIKPLTPEHIRELYGFSTIVTLEEGTLYGGLYSTLAELMMAGPATHPRLRAIAMEEKFAKYCGSYQYALSEHGMSDPQLEERVRKIVSST